MRRRDFITLVGGVISTPICPVRSGCCGCAGSGHATASFTLRTIRKDNRRARRAGLAWPLPEELRNLPPLIIRALGAHGQ